MLNIKDYLLFDSQLSIEGPIEMLSVAKVKYKKLNITKKGMSVDKEGECSVLANR